MLSNEPVLVGERERSLWGSKAASPASLWGFLNKSAILRLVSPISTVAEVFGNPITCQSRSGWRVVTLLRALGGWQNACQL